MNPYSTRTRVSLADLAAWNARQLLARQAYRDRIANPRCGRCGYPETATHDCGT